MPGNNNPANDLLRAVRPTNDPLSLLAQGLAEDGMNSTRLDDETLSVDTEEQSDRLGVNQSRDLRDAMDAQRSSDLQGSIALEYAELRGDRSNLPTVVNNLRRGALANVSPEYLGERIQEIVARAPGRISYALAGKILERSVQQLPAQRTLSRAGFNISRAANALTLGLIGTDERDIGGERVFEQDIINRSVEEISSGLADVNLSTARRREQAVSELNAAEQQYQHARQTFAHIQNLARSGDRRAIAMLPAAQRTHDRLRNQLEMVKRAGQLDAIAQPSGDVQADQSAAEQRLMEAARAYYRGR